MANLLRHEDPNSAVVLYRCHDCNWESMPILSSDDEGEPNHFCPGDCPTCKGNRRVNPGVAEYLGENGGMSLNRIECPVCGGTGRTHS